MIIKRLSEKRGITALYDGHKYIIMSDFYGVVGLSTNIKRNYDEQDCTERSVSIELDVPEWYGYWSLYDIIRRGVKKMEREYNAEKEVGIVLHQVQGEESSLKCRLVIEAERC